MTSHYRLKQVSNFDEESFLRKKKNKNLILYDENQLINIFPYRKKFGKIIFYNTNDDKLYLYDSSIKKFTSSLDYSRVGVHIDEKNKELYKGNTSINEIIISDPEKSDVILFEAVSSTTLDEDDGMVRFLFIYNQEKDEFLNIFLPEETIKNRIIYGYHNKLFKIYVNGDFISIEKRNIYDDKFSDSIYTYTSSIKYVNFQTFEEYEFFIISKKPGKNIIFSITGREEYNISKYGFADSIYVNIVNRDFIACIFTFIFYDKDDEFLVFYYRNWKDKIERYYIINLDDKILYKNIGFVEDQNTIEIIDSFFEFYYNQLSLEYIDINDYTFSFHQEKDGKIRIKPIFFKFEMEKKYSKCCDNKGNIKLITFNEKFIKMCKYQGVNIFPEEMFLLPIYDNGYKITFYSKGNYYDFLYSKLTDKTIKYFPQEIIQKTQFLIWCINKFKDTNLIIFPIELILEIFSFLFEDNNKLFSFSNTYQKLSPRN